MNIPIKTPKEIQIMKEGGKRLSKIFFQLSKMIKLGTSLLDIEKKAIELIGSARGEPAFTKVPKYHWATCLNINEEIVHGVPKDYAIKLGDVVNIDIGLYYKGFNTDMSATFLAENVNSTPGLRNFRVKLEKENPGVDNRKKFLKTGKKALEEAKKQAKPGNKVGHISKKIQEIIEGAGYSCSRTLTGHGIGRKLHERPPIPCFLQGKIEDTPLLKPNMTLAIEVIYCMGKPDLAVDPKDKWTIRTKDGKISGVFEETIAVAGDGHLVLTKLPSRLNFC